MYVNQNPTPDPLYTWGQEGQQKSAAILGLTDSPIGKNKPSDAEVVQRAMSQVNDLVARLERLADTLVGAVPETAGYAADGEAASGVLGVLRVQADNLMNTVTRGHEALSRIERRL